MDADAWRFINTFAPWFSALGTFCAVIISLYLARSRRPIKLKIRVGHRLMMDSSSAGEYPEYLLVDATNVGHRVATITNVGWKTGFPVRSYAIMNVPKDRFSHGIPVKIDDGEVATWLIPMNTGENNWMTHFSQVFLFPHPRWNLFWLRVQVHTSTGKVFEGKIEKELKKRLSKECEKQVNR